MSAKNIKIAPSILSADFTRLGQDVRMVEDAGADLIHIDVMDGHFVPNITIGPLVCASLKPIARVPLDVHLMIENPDLYAPEFIKAGASIVTIHVEATKHLHRSVHLTKSLGAKVGVALNPATPLTALDFILPDLDMVLLMTVNPGFAAQAFIPAVLDKIVSLREHCKKEGLDIDIEVDGGINAETAKLVVDAGANVLVAGNAIFKAKDPMAALGEIRKAVS